MDHFEPKIHYSHTPTIQYRYIFVDFNNTSAKNSCAWEAVVAHCFPAPLLVTANGRKHGKRRTSRAFQRDPVPFSLRPGPPETIPHALKPQNIWHNNPATEKTAHKNLVATNLQIAKQS